MSIETVGPYGPDLLSLWFADQLLNGEVSRFTRIRPSDLSSIKTGRLFPNEEQQTALANCFNTTPVRVLELYRAKADKRCAEAIAARSVAKVG